MINSSIGLVAPNRKQRCDDNMIPMINIVFLLLIFFMIAGHIRVIQDQGIELPVSELGVPAVKQTVTLQLSHQNELYLNGDKILVQQLSAELDVLITNNTALSLQADKRVKAGVLDKTLEVIRSKEIHKITLHAQALLGV